MHSHRELTAPPRRAGVQTCPHPSCSRSFARNFNLQTHIKSHQGIRECELSSTPRPACCNRNQHLLHAQSNARNASSSFRASTTARGTASRSTTMTRTVSLRRIGNRCLSRRASCRSTSWSNGRRNVNAPRPPPPTRSPTCSPLGMAAPSQTTRAIRLPPAAAPPPPRRCSAGDRSPSNGTRKRLRR